ncbi:MAG: hypothetical protein EWV63_04285 [Microcystis aeruginosa Ma_OC_H_19870700_S124]|uniref:Uncharacterized protein n=1 Tax=Microcystis aeruginosa Ma_OC_H_19870700_S124 TaxID=2486262 RepID=A0A552AUP6_MICAE|nr:MAG: hypothetical protein EWV63_04285 [Microcystis aeruginosa Ma_OC_H_19870700_S124]
MFSIAAFCLRRDNLETERPPDGFLVFMATHPRTSDRCETMGFSPDYLFQITHTNPTTNATVTPRTSHLTLRERLRQPAVI